MKAFKLQLFMALVVVGIITISQSCNKSEIQKQASVEEMVVAKIDTITTYESGGATWKLGENSIDKYNVHGKKIATYKKPPAAIPLIKAVDILQMMEAGISGETYMTDASFSKMTRISYQNGWKFDPPLE